jgi:hypothetical protein
LISILQKYRGRWGCRERERERKEEKGGGGGGRRDKSFKGMPNMI